MCSSFVNHTVQHDIFTAKWEKKEIFEIYFAVHGGVIFVSNSPVLLMSEILYKKLFYKQSIQYCLFGWIFEIGFSNCVGFSSCTNIVENLGINFSTQLSGVPQYFVCWAHVMGYKEDAVFLKVYTITDV